MQIRLNVLMHYSNSKDEYNRRTIHLSRNYSTRLSRCKIFRVQTRRRKSVRKTGIVYVQRLETKNIHTPLFRGDYFELVFTFFLK